MGDRFEDGSQRVERGLTHPVGEAGWTDRRPLLSSFAGSPRQKLHRSPDVTREIAAWISARRNHSSSPDEDAPWTRTMFDVRRMSTGRTPVNERTGSRATLDGSTIRAIRASLGMTQIVLAELAGLDQGNLSKIETGARGGVRPSHATVLALAKALGVMPSEIWRRGNGEIVEEEAIVRRLALVRDATSREVQQGTMTPRERAALLRWVRALGNVVDATTAARFLASRVPRRRAPRASGR